MIEISCVASGQPLPSIVWSSNSVLNLSSLMSPSYHVHDELISYNGVLNRKSILQLCNFSSSDEGIYYCSVSNDVGTNDIISFSLQIDFLQSTS